ncbi:MAG: acetyl-CoA hydrolase/transferase family protein [Anaerolineaceae bacterium]|nr:acetyl-CoA hydrolase/transferase family protein [Anaerolineaceae bacterium]
MNSQELYKQKLISISEAVGKLQSHQSLGIAMAASEPQGLLSELSNHRERLEDISVWVSLPMGTYEFITNENMDGHFFIENWFYGSVDRKMHSQGRESYIPNNLHQAATRKLYATQGKVNVFFGTATPPDARGYMSLSLGLVIEKQLIKAADIVILEINENLPWTLGDTQVHISEVDFVVENHVPLLELPVVPPTDVEEKIGGYIASLIEDGSTLQLGIGGIPNAITPFLMDRKDLGIHTEMFTDGMVDLYNSGAITNRKKTLWNGKMVGAFALGTQKLYDFVNNNLCVEFQQGFVTNDPYVIGKNHRMISINTALQVDVFGQVCSQSIGHRHFSGTGGQLDTHRGAQLSEHGRGIIALRSTAKKGEISTLVPTLSSGAEVTITSQDIDTIITEYGIADLKGLCIRDRAKALISIAHPDFREQMKEEVMRLGIVPHF